MSKVVDLLRYRERRDTKQAAAFFARVTAGADTVDERDLAARLAELESGERVACGPDFGLAEALLATARFPVELWWTNSNGWVVARVDVVREGGRVL